MKQVILTLYYNLFGFKQVSILIWVSLVAHLVKSLPAMRTIPGLERSPGERKGYPLQYSGLEKTMDCIVHGLQRVRHD